MSELKGTDDLPFLQRAIDRAACEISLREFVRVFWPWVEPANPLIPGWPLDAVCEHLEAVTYGEIKRLLVNVPPGFMKPNDINGLVLTRRGRVRLGDVVVGDEILTHRGRYRRVTAVHEQGVLPLIEVRTMHGRVNRTAPDHPYLTTRGWVQAKDLVIGDIMGAVVPLEEGHRDHVSPEEARLLGYLVGDGSCTHSPTFVNGDEDVLEDFQRCAEACGCTVSVRKPGARRATVFGIRGALGLLEKHGLRHCNSYTKRIPPLVLASSRQVIANFVGAYWSCDGQVVVRHTGKRGSIYVANATTVGRDLAFDLQHALLRLGIDARVRERTQNCVTKRQASGVYRYYHVQTCAHEDTVLFRDMPGLCPAKRAPLSALSARRFVQGPLFEDEVVAIDEATPGECRCLTVEEDHSFTSADLAIKNSLCTNVFWPAWEWGPMSMPSMRYLCASYSQTLTVRDNNRFRQVITADLFREFWGDRFTLTSDSVEKVQNSATGWKLATSVGGVGTGERGDRVICLPADSVILTVNGWLTIGQIVRERLGVSVAGWDGKKLVWQEIETFEENGSAPVLEISFEGGSLRCTPDHPLFVEGRGWVRADHLQRGDVLWSPRDEALCGLWKGDLGQAKPNREEEMVQPGVPRHRREGDGADRKHAAVHRLRESRLSDSSARTPVRWQDYLQHQMSGGVAYRHTESGLSEWEARHLCMVQTGISLPSSAQPVLLGGVCCECASRRDIASVGISAGLPSLWEAVRHAARHPGLLFAAMRRRSPFASCPRQGQRQVRPWAGAARLSARLDEDLPGAHTQARRGAVHVVQDDVAQARESPLRASRGLRQGESRAVQSDHGLQVLPREDARRGRIPAQMARRVVTDIAAVPGECEVFNLRVTPCHNYFANGVLIHNCDDPNNIKQAESDLIRDETNRWFLEVIPSRLNHPSRSAIIVIQQRTHEEDVSGIILAKELGYEVLMIPMEFDTTRIITTSIGWTDPRGLDDYGEPLVGASLDAADGVLAWPERYPPEVIPRMKHKELGPYGWAGQMQQAPQPRGGGIFKMSWWKDWPPPEWPDVAALRRSWPPMEYVCASLDCAYTEKEENDFNALTVWGVYRRGAGVRTPPHVRETVKGDFLIDDDRRPKLLLMYAWQKRLELHGEPEADGLRIAVHRCERCGAEGGTLHQPKCPRYMEMRQAGWGVVEWVVDSCRRYHVDHLLIEAKASGHTVAQELARLYGAEDWAVELVEPHGDKVARAYSVQHLLSNGLVYAPRTENDERPRWAEEVITQMANFPKTRHKDLVDSAVHALRHLRDIGLAVRTEEFDREAQEEVTYRRTGRPLYEA